MLYPDTWIDVGGDVGLAVNGQRRQRQRHNILAGIGKDHAGPAFPLADRATDSHGAGTGFDDASAGADVDSETGVEGQPVTSPLHIAFDRCERIAVFKSGTHGDYQARKALTDCDVAQASDELMAQAAALM